MSVLGPQWNDMGIHGGQVQEYIARHHPRGTHWSLEQHDVEDQHPDPNGVRSRQRMARAEQGYREHPEKMPPITVIEHEDGTREHVDGWHRLGAAQRAGLKTVPAWVGRPR